MDGVQVLHAPKAASVGDATNDYITRTTQVLSPKRTLKHQNSMMQCHPDAKTPAVAMASPEAPNSDEKQPLIVLSATKEQTLQRKPRASEYHSRLRYKPTTTANGHSAFLPLDPPSPLDALSIPNTFKNKLHPNAQATSDIGIWHDIREERKSDTLTVQDKTDSRQRSHNEDSDDTPSWMPSLLHEKWPAYNPDDSGDKADPETADLVVRKPIAVAPSISNFHDVLESSSAQTMIHNSDYLEHEEPAWKHANGAYEAQRDAKFDLRNIFLSLNSDERRAMKPQSKPQNVDTTEGYSHHSDTAYSKGLTTHYDDTSLTPTKAPPHLTPGVFRNPDSPLKLFNGDRYNTFTKNKLSDFLQNFGHAREVPPAPKSTTKSFNEHSHSMEVSLDSTSMNQNTVDYPIKRKAQQFASKDDYLKNANDLYAKLIQNPVHNATISKPPSFCRSTSTSTPLKYKVSNAIEPQHFHDSHTDSLSSELDAYTLTSIADGEEEQGRPEGIHIDQSHTFDTVSEGYTAADHGVVPRIMKPSAANGTSMYTFDETDKSGLLETAIRHDSAELEHTFSIYSEAMNEAAPLKEQTSPRKALREFSTNRSPQIKWKSVSQLKASRQPPSLAPVISAIKPHLGKVLPDQYHATSFDGMVFDEENHRWVLRSQEENEHGSLDSIEDLPSDTFLRRHKGVGSNNNRNDLADPQVSFQMPHLSIKPVLNDCIGKSGDVTRVGTCEEIVESAGIANVTQVADLEDISYLESQRRMVAIITDVLDDHAGSVDWKVVNEIELQARGIDNIVSLQEILPGLRSVNLAHNSIEFLQGLPGHVYDLDVSSNKISNMTLFSLHQGLTRLNVSHNSLTGITNLSYNMALACLDVSHNLLGSFLGIEGLLNLTSLNLSSNQISGTADFSHCLLPHLTKLDLSHNEITEITGLESMPGLRILDVAHNQLTSLDFGKTPPSQLRKLLVQGNELDTLDVTGTPRLRVLRTDAARSPEIQGLNKLRHLEELSCRGGRTTIGDILLNVDTVQTLDLSGRSILSFPPGKQLMSVTNLNLSACNFESIPADFCRVFPNVRKLNLNFNRLRHIDGLSNLKHLQELSILSNCIENLSGVVAGISGLRRSLRVFDLRLNPLTFNIYPWVFDPLESSAIHNMLASGQGPIQFDKFDDIDPFLVNYTMLRKNFAKWEARDDEFSKSLEKHDQEKHRRRQEYEATVITVCRTLQMLDGRKVTSELQAAAKTTWLNLANAL